MYSNSTKDRLYPSQEFMNFASAPSSAPAKTTMDDKASGCTSTHVSVCVLLSLPLALVDMGRCCRFLVGGVQPFKTHLQEIDSNCSCNKRHEASEGHEISRDRRLPQEGLHQDSAQSGSQGNARTERQDSCMRDHERLRKI